MKIQIIIGALTFFFVTACNKEKIDPSNRWTLPPNVFYYQLLKSTNEHLSSVEIDSLKLFYINTDGERQYSNPTEGLDYPQFTFRPSFHGSSDNILDDAGILMLLDINGRGLTINTWYLEQMDGRIDTLYVESKKISQKEGMQDPCYCTDPFTVVRLNGKDATIHPTLRSSAGKNVYVLKP